MRILVGQPWRHAIIVFLLAGPGAHGVAADKVDFVRDVQPILKAHCYSCHGEQKQLSGLRLDVKAAAHEGGRVAWRRDLAGRSAESVLIQLVRSDDKDVRMPPEGPPLSAEQIDVLRRWIEEGAVWPDGVDTAVVENRLDHWSFQPLRQFSAGMTHRPLHPGGAGEAGLAMSGPADRRTLIRRLSLVLHGLAPSPEEVAAFAADEGPHASKSWWTGCSRRRGTASAGRGTGWT